MAESMATRISGLLVKQDMTQKELASLAGITESAISHYIKGDRVPRGVNLIKVAKALGTTSDYLLGQDNKSSDEDDFRLVKTIIARNAAQMTTKEKMEIIRILSNED